jgi:hypothetical protein
MIAPLALLAAVSEPTQRDAMYHRYRRAAHIHGGSVDCIDGG